MAMATSDRQTVQIPTAEIGRHAANFTIGFGNLSVRDNVEYVESAGSGTLVTVGSLQGILTAAHVLDALPDDGAVAIILNSESSAHFRKVKKRIKKADKLLLRSSE